MHSDIFFLVIIGTLLPSTIILAIFYEIRELLWN